MSPQAYEWQPIATAPMDGTSVLAGAIGTYKAILHPVTSRYIGGNWCANFGADDWHKYEPQPTHWRSQQ